MLYLAIPAYNEVATIGVLLWRLRTVLAEFPREYEVVVYDDASTDETATVAEQYERAMPVRVLRGTQHLGYAGATEALLRHIANATRYPRRDAVLLMQGDFTDPPVLVPEFARRFEGGADLVVGERTVVADAPVPVRRLFRAAHWAMRPFVRVDDVRDLTASMRLVRIAALRDALRAAGPSPFLGGDSWTANADLLLQLAPHARRVESVPMEPTYGVRMRETRRVAMRDGLAVLKWAWGARSRKAVIGSETESSNEGGRGERGQRRREEGGRDARRDRRDEPELSVERLREKVREREGTRGLDGAPPPETRRERQRSRERDKDRETESRSGERPQERPSERGTESSSRRERGHDRSSERDGERPARAERGERSPRPERQERAPQERAPRGRNRTDVAASSDGEAAPAREARPPRGRGGDEQSPARRPRREDARDEAPRAAFDAGLELDDPFAPPAPRRDRFEQVLDGRPERPLHRDSASEASASESAPWTGDTDARVARDTVPEQSADTRPRVTRPAAADDDVSDVDDADVGEGDNAEDDAEGEGQPRKRRRNRRSRRGRKRRSGELSEGGEGESEASESVDADGEGASGEAAGSEDGEAAPRAPRARQPRPLEGAPVAPRAQGDGEESGDDSADEPLDDASEEFDEESSARPRRRGRRGRRGGARRSRGRRDRGDGESGGESGDAQD